MLEKLLDYIHEFFKPQPSTEERNEPMLPLITQVLSLASVIKDLVDDDKNDANSDHVEEIVKNKISTEVMAQIDEHIGADASHKFNSFMDLVKGK
tara:strand:- start:145 stop:429 length:285 start_codon:yes stop_codon:yes gene_type:complete